jgi:hypothetical protein
MICQMKAGFLNPHHLGPNHRDGAERKMARILNPPRLSGGQSRGAYFPTASTEQEASTSTEAGDGDWSTRLPLLTRPLRCLASNGGAFVGFVGIFEILEGVVNNSDVFVDGFSPGWCF